MTFPLVLHTVQLSNVCIPLFMPDAAAVKEAHRKGEIASPYWSQVWPAAKALAGFILDNLAYTDGKKVIELGAGLGLPSLVAARNATAVLCTDSEPAAVAVAKQSADHVNLKNFRIEILDWQKVSYFPSADVLLLSDLSYDPSAFSSLLKTIEIFLEKETTVLLSTPQRLMAKEFVAPLLPYCINQKETIVTHNGKAVAISVMVLRKS